MYESKEEISDFVDALFEAFEPLNRGDILAHGVISSILGVEPHRDHWQHCMNKVKRRMERERGITLWPEHTVGYKLCTVQEQIDLAHEYTIRARRRIKRGLRALRALPMVGLSLYQQKLRAAQSANLSRSHRELSAQLQQRSVIGRVTETLPRRPIKRD